MAKRKRRIDRETVESNREKAKNSNGCLAIETKAGRVFSISPAEARCKAIGIEFVDADKWHITLAYDQIANVEIKTSLVPRQKSHHRRLCRS